MKRDAKQHGALCQAVPRKTSGAFPSFVLRMFGAPYACRYEAFNLSRKVI